MTIKKFNQFFQKDFDSENTHDRITVKELEQIFHGGMPDAAFKFLISPTNGKTVAEIREVLHSISNGTFVAPTVINTVIKPIVSEPFVIEPIVIEPVKKKRVRKTKPIVSKPIVIEPIKKKRVRKTKTIV